MLDLESGEGLVDGASVHVGDVSVQAVGPFDRIKSGCVGFFIGIPLFLFSFILLWSNEGRVNLGIVAQRSVEFNANEKRPDLEGKFVAALGELNALGKGFGDKMFMKKAAGKFLVLQRHVEMYCWHESSHTTGTKKNRVRVYTYNKSWSADPPNSGYFHNKAGHENPPKEVPNATFRAKNITLGKYRVHEDLPLRGNESLPIDRANLKLEKFRGASSDGTSIFLPYKGQSGGPNVGDLRVRYSCLRPPQSGVVLASIVKGNLMTYFDVGDRVDCFRFFPGLDRNGAIEELKTEHTITTWILRFMGFAMMWLGFGLLFSPVTAILSYLPFVGGLLEGIVGVSIIGISFLVAAGLSLATIVLSLLAHNPILGLIFLVCGSGVILAIGFAWRAARRR